MVKVDDYMSWIDTRSDIDIQISKCYSMIEELQNRIKELEAQKKSESRIDDLVKQLTENQDPEPIEHIIMDMYGADVNEFEDPKEFTQHYCYNCGSQRCEGIGTEWFEGCQHKEHLKNYEKFYGDD